MRWKFYFWVITPLMVAGTGLAIAESLGFLLDEGDPFFDEPWTWLDWLDTFIISVSLIGLFGIAYQKTIGKQIFWKRWFVFVIIFDIAYIINDYRNGIYGTEDMWRPEIVFPLLIIIVLPYYIGLYLYAFKSDAVWNPQPTPTQ